MKKKCFMFMGQGSQKVGMGLDFYNKNCELKQLFGLANEIFNTDLSKICFKGPEKLLTQTINVQPIITIFNLFIYQLVSKEIPQADYIIGHSLGEISALYAAGVLNLEETFQVLKYRAELMEEASLENKGAMYSLLGADITELKSMIAKFSENINIGLINSSNQMVISGDEEELNTFIKNLSIQNKAVKHHRLKVSGAWHSNLMKEAENKFRERISSISFKKPNIPLVMNVNAKITNSAEQVKENVIRQFTTTVNWLGIINLVVTNESPIFVSIGLGKVLKGLILNIDRTYNSYAIETIRDYERMIQELKPKSDN